MIFINVSTILRQAKDFCKNLNSGSTYDFCLDEDDFLRCFEFSDSLSFNPSNGLEHIASGTFDSDQGSEFFFYDSIIKPQILNYFS